MRKLSHIGMPILLVGLFAVWPRPVSAQCVSCGPGGECFDAPDGFSANCECRIRNVRGAVVCTPHGVCSPNDSTSCDDAPSPFLVPGGKISTKFIQGLAEKNPLLAGAVWGAVTEQDSASRQTLYSRLVAGEYTGTMGKGGKSYSFRTRVQSLAGGAFSLAVHVKEDGTGRVDEFEGIVLDEGQAGNLVQVGQEGRKSVFSWNAPDRVK
ncbi:MAG TPA: hypothetical protein VLX28_04180 [Thermoanaerobaculia bacterium]|nr:hypothetical protein [Thermoanaerobaculia bacterium]